MDLTAIKTNSFKWKSINTLLYAQMGRKTYLFRIINQKSITMSLMSMKTTTKTDENQKFKRKVREESVEAI